MKKMTAHIEGEEEMKMESKRPTLIEIDDEDEDFLAQVSAVEANAIFSKRQKITSSVTNLSRNVVVENRPLQNVKEDEEGVYTAALRGTHNLQVLPASSNHRAEAGGSCFKCGQAGHWARDCVFMGGGAGRNHENLGNGSSVAEKACPCGLGPCLVLTANTSKNPGRKFYKCPFRQESGGCGFFEWRDSAAGSNSITHGVQTNPFKSSFLDRGIIEEHTSPSSFSATDNKSSVQRSGLSCFKCGISGHWAKDCSVPSSNSSADSGGKSSSGSCYKCGKPGHWARDCPIS